MKTCFLFPGQGAQYPGMAKDLWDASPAVRELFAEASEAAAVDLRLLLFEGSEEQLKVTQNTQAAVTVANLAAAWVLRERGVPADACAGFSVGEYAALAAAGVVSVGDAFRLVGMRGELMERYSRVHDGAAGPSAMSAVIGLSFDEVATVMATPVVVCADPADSSTQDVFIANHSSPIQVVLAGTAAGLDRAESALKAAGAMRIVRLNVSGPFHSPLLNAAKQEFEQRIAAIPFADPQIPLYSNVTGAVVHNGADAKALAGRQIVETVRWVDIETQILAAGAERVLEVGPGKVLTGLWKSFNKTVKCVPVGTNAQIDELSAAVADNT